MVVGVEQVEQELGEEGDDGHFVSQVEEASLEEKVEVPVDTAVSRPVVHVKSLKQLLEPRLEDGKGLGAHEHLLLFLKLVRDVHVCGDVSPIFFKKTFLPNVERQDC